MAIKKIKKRQVLGEVREEKLSSAKLNEVIDEVNAVTASAGVLKSKTIEVTSAQILAQDEVPFNVAVPGKMILPVHGVIVYNHVTTAYDGDGAVLIIKKS